MIEGGVNMKKSDARQMAREIRGFVVGNKADVNEVMGDYLMDMPLEDVYLVEDTYFEMLRGGEFEDITGIQ
jgi:hypothetical protein